MSDSSSTTRTLVDMSIGLAAAPFPSIRFHLFLLPFSIFRLHPRVLSVIQSELTLLA